MDLVDLWDLICVFCALCLFFSISCYLFPNFLLGLARPQDLRKKYGDWAVVTGGSSGIGKAIVRRLAEQSVNVCIVALDDKLLTETVREFSKDFPEVTIRAVAVDLGSRPDRYMRAIEQATHDVKVSILINNAGFLKMGFFDQISMDTHSVNMECNAIAAIRLTHHFYSRMIRDNIKGCITFTSSAVFFMPSPFAIMYGATKAMLSTFATSLAIEAKSHGVHVTVFHPSYTHSNLYAGAPKVGVLKVLAKFGFTPDNVARVVFASVGRVVVRDIGIYALMTNLVGRLFDSGFLASCMIPFRNVMAPPGHSAKAKAICNKKET